MSPYTPVCFTYVVEYGVTRWRPRLAHAGTQSPLQGLERMTLPGCKPTS